ncbi:tetratricopeptide repeat protein [Candidatus Parcubacteria bacterium]|nr:tetratricopeptide repeat protein [Candidatus Parcubacteria bacterium]
MEEKKIKNLAKENKKEKHFSTRGLDIIISLVIGLIFFLTPLFFTGFIAQGLGFEKMILFYFLVLIGIVAWVTKGVICGELNLKRTPLDIPIILTLAVFILSTILSVNSVDSLIGSYGSSSKSLIALIVFILFYYLVVNNLNAKKIKIFFWIFISSISVLTIYVLLQFKGWYILPFPFAKNAGFNPLGSLSALTMFLVISLPLISVALAQTREILSKANSSLIIIVKSILGLVAIGAFIILFLLSGFTFWPIAIVGAAIVLMFYLAKIIKISNNNLLIPLGVFLVLITLLVLGNFNFASMNLPAEVSLSREASWNIAKASLKENPIFGSGPSTFYYSFSKFKSGDFNSSPLWNVRFDSSSGSLFEFLATVGPLGLLSIIILALTSLSIIFLSIIKTKDKEIASILLALFASFVSAILFSLLFAQNNSLILLTVLISIFAVSSAMVMYPEKFKDLKLSFRASPKYALALSAIFLTVSAGVVILFTMGLKMYLADVYAKEAMESGNIDKKIEKLNKAVSLSPYRDSYYINAANAYMAKANQLALSGSNQPEVSANLSRAIEQGKKAVDLAKNKAANNESLALIYENTSFFTRDALTLSEQSYQKVIELDPKNPTPYLRIALINMARANAEADEEEKKYFIGEAIKKYDEAIKKKGDLAAAYYGKAIAYEKMTDIDNAIENLKQANLASRNNLDYRFELGRLYFNRGVVQPNLSQTVPEQITENDINPENASSSAEQLSVKPTRTAGNTVGKNGDIVSAEQLFLSIIKNNPNHANALYSLAVLYQKIGETENAKMAVQSLLNVLQDESVKNTVKQQFKDIL